MKRLLILPLLALGACAHAPGGSVSGGECKFLERPTYAVRGVRPYDQDWIDNTVEGGVGACGWQRPAARPAEMDAPKAAPARAPKAKSPMVKGPKPWLRFLHAFKKQEPAAQAEAPAVEVAAPEPPAPPPAPKRPIDVLLGGSK